MQKLSVKNKPKILVILGPTASGKSALAVQLARAFKGNKGEIISADSRQVYTGMDIGSGKITSAEMKGVPHHMLDIVSPKRVQEFTVAEFQKMGQEKIADIIARGKLPIICGGSAFYIQALVDSIIFPEVLPNKKLRAKLEKKTTEQLCAILKKLDKRRFAEIDTANPRRLIRAIEIATKLGAVPKLQKAKKLYDPLFIGTVLPEEKLRQKINVRLESRLKGGMIREVSRLHKNGVSWKRLEKFGLEYRWIARFLQKKVSRADMITQLEQDIWQFSKRQMTWFKRDARIHWFDPKEFAGIKKLTETFLS